MISIAAILIRFSKKCYGIKGKKNKCAEIIIKWAIMRKKKNKKRFNIEINKNISVEIIIKGEVCAKIKKAYNNIIIYI